VVVICYAESQRGSLVIAHLDHRLIVAYVVNKMVPR